MNDHNNCRLQFGQSGQSPFVAYRAVTAGSGTPEPVFQQRRTYPTRRGLTK